MQQIVIVVAVAVMAAFILLQQEFGGPPVDTMAALEAGEDATTFERNSASAAKGDAAAQLALGLNYQTGQGVKQDVSRAAVWFQRAATQGEAKAMVALALMYENGSGVPRDYLEAYKWFNIAAAQLTADNERALGVKGRDRIAPRMTPAQISEAQRLSSIWMPVKERP